MEKHAFTASQQRCIDALTSWAGGEHHLGSIAPFGSGVRMHWRGQLSTYDDDSLTRLVLVAHRAAVRIELAASGPWGLAIIVHPRDPAGARLDTRHLTLKELAERCKML